ncbi:phage tail family protein [Staphylococcus haemolyticus]|uniref:phage distal tail protein n=2 Tax=Staphylococcus haemolyticus TaxID=1283 RepID=UPI0028A37EE3|nr:phage tail domain-containing protein [Staphylococcus haemolyticus]MDT4195357.1 phage tail family protein [Staphylococcus haemolyticus]MDT4199046.1 phage tail family protein [Staphylococcus haemolyticus]MDT4205644.1 phage tail family protein [Staphylococcus haemolyticus]MDT4236551.1 phage tail family protein [Staphylococcus haemolyticus]MDT4247872.1 phage tail family protein [Staphylococcus haemolyticus]
MIDTIKVNNKTLPWLVVERGFKIPSFNFGIETEEVLGRSGSVVKQRQLKEYKFELPLIIRNDYLSSGGVKTHDEVLNDLVKLFDYDHAVPLQFKSQDWYWNAYFEGPIELDKYSETFWQFSINVVLADPYKYAVEGTKNTAISDQVSVVSAGTADSPIIVQATALKNASYFSITKNDEDYFMIGDDDLDKKVEDYTPTLFNDEMRSFFGWTKVTNGTINDNVTGGTVGGAMAMSSSKDAFMLNESSITSTSGWNGAEYKHSFGKSTQDFSSTVKIHVNQSKKGATHATQYVYDTDNRVIASIGYSNPRATQNIGTIHVTLFDQNGNQKTIYRYTNAPKFYTWKHIVIYMRLKRIGDKFYIKTWKYDEVDYPKRITPVDVTEKVFIDSGNFYQRPISAVSIYIAKNGNNYHMPTTILGSYNHEILPKPPKARDLIIKKGDLININMEEKTVTINEEPALDLKTFGSDFFDINKGMNECMIYPENTYDTTVYWQDRYL